MAHFASLEARATRATLGIDGMKNMEALKSVIARIATMLDTITGLMEAARPEEASTS